QAERKAYAQLMRSRLQELSATMNTRLPLYVTFTKLDLLRGFDVVYEQLDKEAREAVLGVTFKPDERQGKGWQDDLSLFW
ncbi:type VI secretion protein IcmF/TssM N-terminal domain-containing protein, partial [Aeromonas allosaccharophila]|uniref:type VI secretion protein IcmF/TssM N-terminal domain-containing protein n=1 Tax=Aeromonas allosaccharophila TaxID=656 RepID=UPI0036DD0DE2